MRRADVFTAVSEIASEEGKRPSGRVLAVREASDDVEGPCAPWSDASASESTLVVREIVLDTETTGLAGGTGTLLWTGRT